MEGMKVTPAYCDRCFEHLIPDDDGIFCHVCVRIKEKASHADGVMAGVAKVLDAVGHRDTCKFCGVDVWFLRPPKDRVRGWWIFGADGERHNCT